MRQLRYLRPGDDGNHVILETADGGEQFVLYVTVPLRDAVRVDLPKLHPSAPQHDEGITPREIQVRVRAGTDPEVLAEAHGMTLERVLRFAGPVLDERARIADTARRGRARRSTTEGQTVVFGEAVDNRFAAHGIDPFTVRWDAYRRLDGQWIVTADWIGGADEHRAEWTFHLNARNVTPLDDAAADLLSDRPVRPMVAVIAEPEPDLSDAPPLAPGVVAFPRLASAPAEPEPEVAVEVVDEDVFDQDAFDQVGVIDDDAAQVAEAQDLEPVSGEDFDAPPLPLRLAEPADERPAADSAKDEGDSTTPLPRLRNLGVAPRDEPPAPARAKSHSRPKVPAWDDIMLGVRRQTD
ncbi:MAG: hypothetical protein QOG80_2551 [Pseudonocardiales bacterium]|jgi:hypothetical protein|nr:hypothetical protein [Pseudonocardiales bacterium]